MLAREQEGKEFGVIVLAEGLAEYLPAEYLEGVTFDDHGHISLAADQPGAQHGRRPSRQNTRRRTGKKRRVTGLQLGYEARLRPAARLRRHARQPARRRGLSRPGRETSSTA